MRAGRSLYFLTVLLMFATFLLIVIGGIVHNTDSGMACPDWPLCYGEVFPEMKGHILYEHGHRYLATLVGCGVLFLSIRLWNFHAPSITLVRSKKILLSVALMLSVIIVILITPIGQGTKHWNTGAGQWAGLISI